MLSKYFFLSAVDHTYVLIVKLKSTAPRHVSHSTGFGGNKYFWKSLGILGGYIENNIVHYMLLVCFSHNIFYSYA